MIDPQLETLDPNEFQFWQPPEGMTMTTGEETEIAIPQIPLPVLIKDINNTDKPTEKTIGDGLYAYLCRFPFCEHADQYALIIKEAFPFFIADIGSQLILLDMKDVEAGGLVKKIAYLKILHYLEPDNFGLMHKIGAANFDLGLNYQELSRVKTYLKEARSWLEKARRTDSEDAGNLNFLGQVCFMIGIYHQAKLYWKKAISTIEDGEKKQILEQRLKNVTDGNVPEQPLVDSLEKVAASMEHVQIEEFDQAREIMEHLEAVGDLPREMPNPEFYYLLGLVREKCDDISGAYEGYQMALDLDNDHKPSQDGLLRVTTEEA